MFAKKTLNGTNILTEVGALQSRAKCPHCEQLSSRGAVFGLIDIMQLVLFTILSVTAICIMTKQKHIYITTQCRMITRKGREGREI